MEMKDFIKKWGGFIALCLIAVMLLVIYIISECQFEVPFFRIIIGLIAMPLFTFCGFGAVMSFMDAKGF